MLVLQVPTMLEDPENPSWSDVSVEFCGGTHLSNTREAQAFVLLEEVGVASFCRYKHPAQVDESDNPPPPRCER